MSVLGLALALCAAATWSCALASATAPSGIDYCSSRELETQTQGHDGRQQLYWSAEATSAAEFVVDAHSKSLHCCGKGYRTIEWYKDDQAYPWGTDVSSFILYPAAANQTVYTRRADGTVDHGRYTCHMTNATHARRHTVTLHVVESAPSVPRATFAPTDQLVELGATVRIYCEAFIGDMKLPDAHRDIWWWRVQDPEQEPPLKQEKVLRSEGQVVGSWLVLEGVTESDYGAYTCSARNADRRIDMPIQLHHKLGAPRLAEEGTWRRRTAPALAGVGAALALLALLAAWRSRRARRHAARACVKLSGDVALQEVHHKNDAACADVALVYAAADAEVCMRLLRPALMRRFRYSVRLLPLPDDTQQWSSVLRDAGDVRVLLAVLSPASFLSTALNTALAALRHAAHTLTNTKPVVVMLQDVPAAAGSEVSSVTRGCRVLRWRRGPADRRFWLSLRLSLRLALPLLPRRDSYTHAAADQQP